MDRPKGTAHRNIKDAYIDFRLSSSPDVPFCSFQSSSTYIICIYQGDIAVTLLFFPGVLYLYLSALASLPIGLFLGICKYLSDIVLVKSDHGLLVLAAVYLVEGLDSSPDLVRRIIQKIRNHVGTENPVYFRSISTEYSLLFRAVLLATDPPSCGRSPSASTA